MKSLSINVTLLLLFFSSFLVAQTSKERVIEALSIKEKMAKNAIVKNNSFTNIGPSIMSGRVVDIDVNPNNTVEFYVGYASGGVWYTNNNGTSFSAVFDNAPTQNVGAIAKDWKNGTLWVGTGESNSSRSSYAGIGVLKSSDNGNTWVNVGLTDSHHIGQIILNKDNPDEVIVAAIGHLYSSNKERGVFKTSDGGKTWKNTLFINEQTGIIDISVSPQNPAIMYASSWERNRTAWNFDGDGIGSGIYKSENGGDTWTKITLEGKGFPTGSGVGRIGLAAFNNEVVYALLDNQFRRPSPKKTTNKTLSKEDFKTMSVETFMELEDNKLTAYLKTNRFDDKETATSVKKAVKEGKLQPSDLASYLEDANSLLFDTPVIGAEVYKSTNGGQTWEKTHQGYLDDVYSSYGYYFGSIGVNLLDENNLYIGGVPLLKSADGGKTFQSIGADNVHSDHQAIWVNPLKKGHLINGNDGGINISFDDGAHWSKNNSPAVGQFYAINVDNKTPYNVYGGLQDNGVWYGPSTYKASKSWEARGAYPYKAIGGGDGMQVQIDNRDNETVYSGSQFGYYYRINTRTKERLGIHPKHQLGETPYRYNWQTPILLSPHNQDILYMGANKLLRSMDKGEHFEVISGDLTNGGKKGNVPYGTITTIAESPLQFGLLYTGSDDGVIQLSKNGGASWDIITNNLPKGLWVSRIEASKFHKNRVYATLNGYRFDDFNAYVFQSNDYGTTWTNITSNIAPSPVNVIKEDTENEQVLFVGTDNGLYVSFNQGASWEVFSNNLPNVAIHDLAIQKRDKELVIGTHGRSIYKINIAAFQLFSADIAAKAIHIFPIKSVKHSASWGRTWSQWRTAKTPKVTIPIYVSNDSELDVTIFAGKVMVYSETHSVAKGFNDINYDLSFSKKGLKNYTKSSKNKEITKASNGVYYLPKGTYTVQIGAAEETLILD